MGIKKFYLSTLELHDKENDDSVVRELEMCVDNVVPSVGYSIQFWRDVRLYGVAEAILYLKDIVSEKSYVSIQDDWNRIKERIC